jgi:hypothetical protein
MIFHLRPLGEGWRHLRLKHCATTFAHAQMRMIFFGSPCNYPPKMPKC